MYIDFEGVIQVLLWALGLCVRGMPRFIGSRWDYLIIFRMANRKSHVLSSNLKGSSQEVENNCGNLL